MKTSAISGNSARSRAQVVVSDDQDPPTTRQDPNGGQLHLLVGDEDDGADSVPVDVNPWAPAALFRRSGSQATPSAAAFRCIRGSSVLRAMTATGPPSPRASASLTSSTIFMARATHDSSRPD